LFSINLNNARSGRFGFIENLRNKYKSLHESIYTFWRPSSISAPFGVYLITLSKRFKVGLLGLLNGKTARDLS
jgi:hypothetical protein